MTCADGRSHWFTPDSLIYWNLFLHTQLANLANNTAGCIVHGLRSIISNMKTMTIQRDRRASARSPD
jgi:hypothetical protein